MDTRPTGILWIPVPRVSIYMDTRPTGILSVLGVSNMGAFLTCELVLFLTTWYISLTYTCRFFSLFVVVLLLPFFILCFTSSLPLSLPLFLSFSAHKPISILIRCIFNRFGWIRLRVGSEGAQGSGEGRVPGWDVQQRRRQRQRWTWGRWGRWGRWQ